MIFISSWAAKTKFGKMLGTALLVIILGAVAANIGLIPSASNSVSLYSEIFHYIAPLSIFYLVLGVNLKQIKAAGLPILSLFVIGVCGTVLGVFIAYSLVNPETVLGDQAAPIAGMVAGTYTGGSLNFNAVALHYKVNESGVLYAGTVAVDNVITALWMLITIALPKLMQRFTSKSDRKDSAKAKAEDVASLEGSYKQTKSHSEVSSPPISMQDLLILLPIGLFAFVLTEIVSHYLPDIPSILTITTIGLLLAQLKVVHKITSSHTLGVYLVYLFLVVIGAYCELDAIYELGEIGLALLLLLSLTVVIHGFITLIAGHFIGKDWKMVAIASQANIGGGTTAMALAETFGRRELIVPAILIGSLGNALGTYLGFLVAGSLA
ncbi:MAG: DUF819 family protein [Gammaproteobacteria bacterium]|nr:DUF819 family protein [Gammaproteobacteria bacterium]